MAVWKKDKWFTVADLYNLSVAEDDSLLPQLNPVTYNWWPSDVTFLNRLFYRRYRTFRPIMQDPSLGELADINVVFSDWLSDVADFLAVNSKRCGDPQKQPTLVSQEIKPRRLQVSSHSAPTLAWLCCGLGFGYPTSALGSPVFIPGSLLWVHFQAPFQVCLFCCFDYNSDTRDKASFRHLERYSRTFVCIKITWPHLRV